MNCVDSLTRYVDTPGYCPIEKLPPGYRPFKVNRVIDGDTYEINADLDGNGKLDSVRVKGVNTREMGKGPTLQSRMKKAEPGAREARRFLVELTENKTVYINPRQRDGYGRLLTETYIEFQSSPRNFITLDAVILMEGHAEVYFVQVPDRKTYEYYIRIREWARMFGIGIWKEGRPDVGITSFHPDGRGEKDDPEPIFNEYARLVINKEVGVNLKDYYFWNDARGAMLRLPDCVVPTGRTVKVVSGGIETQCNPDDYYDPEKQLEVSLGMTKPFWENKEEGGACLVIYDRNGKVVDYASKYGYEPCPPSSLDWPHMGKE